MRIIAGALAGRPIRRPKGDAARPAMARTREAVFSMLEARGAHWPDTNVLDLFAGSGSLAFEALSRGAQSALLVDNSEEMLKVIAATAGDLDLGGRLRSVKSDALRFLRKPRGLNFNLVFVDPPYRRDFTGPVLAQLAAGGWIAPNAFIVAEIEKGAGVNAPRELDPETVRLFGQTEVHIWKNKCE